MAHDFRTKQKKANEHPPVNDRRVVFRSCVASSYLPERQVCRGRSAFGIPGNIEVPEHGPLGHCQVSKGLRRLVGQGCHAEATPIKQVNCRFARMLKGKTGLLDPARN